ncbi:hypothetical protein JW948_16475 [bacterium]|nr:hypothetical protein [bacterium]
MHFLQPVKQHGAVFFFADVLADLEGEAVRSDADDIFVECRLVDFMI